jgi:GST-like protein
VTYLDSFAMTQKWPAQHPDRPQLYSLPTPNGVKVSIMKLETGLPYEAHRVSFDTNDQLLPEVVATCTNNKIPVILNPNGPGDRPLALFKSDACLLYPARTGRLCGSARRGAGLGGAPVDLSR